MHGTKADPRRGQGHLPGGADGDGVGVRTPNEGVAEGIASRVSCRAKDVAEFLLYKIRRTRWR